jgi:hypothetical protein
MSIRLLLATALGLALAAGRAAGAASAPKPGFAPGTWVGSGVHKGVFTLAGNSSPTTGTVSFTLVVDPSLRARGTLTLKSTMRLAIADMRGTVSGAGTLAISGTGSDVRFAGTIAMRGRITDGKVTVPWQTTRPLSGRLIITRAGCTQVVGKTAQNFPISWTAVPKPGTLKTRCA